MIDFSQVVSRIDDFATLGLQSAIFAGFFAGLLAIVVLIVTLVFRRALSANQRGMLWGLVLLRLLLPVAPSSVLSLQNIGFFWETDAATETATVTQDAVAPADIPASTSAPQVATSAADPPLSVFSLCVEALLENLHFVWLAGAFLTALWIFITHWRFCRRVKRSANQADPRLQQLLAECCKLVRLRRRVAITVFDGISQPAVMGLLRPKLLLPPDATNLSDEELQMIILHELAHVRRNDIAANWLLVLIRAIHWWNPIYWLAASRYRSLREQSCDAFVIRHLTGEANTEQPSRAYGELLLTLAERTSSATGWRVTLPASMLGFLSSYFRKRTVSNRLKALRRANPIRGRWHRAAFATLIILVAICGLTDARSVKEPEEPDERLEWPFRATFSDQSTDTEIVEDLGPMETRTHDLTKAIDRIAVDEGDREKALARLIEHFAFLSQLKRKSRQPSATAAQDEAASLTVPVDASYAVGDNSVIVHAPLKLQEEVIGYLRAWETSGLGQICVECRFITTPHDIASINGIEWQYFDNFSSEKERFSAHNSAGMPGVKVSSGVYDCAPIGLAHLNDQQAGRLIQRTQGHRRSNVLYAPKVTIFNGQQASIADCSHTPFVIGVTKLKTGEVKPRIVTLDEGTKMLLQPVLSSDHRKVLLNARIELSAIDEVRTVTTAINGKETTIQLPSVKRQQIDINREIENGGSLLIGCCTKTESGSSRQQLLSLLLRVYSVETD